MDHVAIMRKSWGFLPKILDGRKKIESRWSRNKVAPFGKVKVGDTIYFKNSGEKISAKATVSKVLQFESLNSQKVKEILNKYGTEIGISPEELESMSDWAKDKRYCTLIYLAKPKEVIPFNINKHGFGAPIAWISVNNVQKLRLRE